MRYVFGPVPSRRLGRSLGVNNVPPKHCSYSCVYCQLGRTTDLTCARRAFYPWRDVVGEVASAVRAVGEGNVDYVTFAPDGEPTLDANLGLEIGGVKEETGKPVAVLTNGSLLFREDVRQELCEADLVSVKVDAAGEGAYRRVNRPHPGLRLELVLEGLREFARGYRGRLVTETMLVRGVNDGAAEVERVARFLRSVGPSKAYVAVPTRPPAEPWVRPASEEAVLRAYSIFREHLGRERVELLVGYEGPSFGAVGDPVEGLLATASVHPLRLDYAYAMLEGYGLDPEAVLGELVREGKVVVLEYGGHRFVMRRIASRSRGPR